MPRDVTQQLNDDELYQNFLSGDTDSYDQLMIRYGDSLTKYLYGYLKSWEDAEDMMIEAFARIMAKAPQIADGAFKAYLYKTGRNLSIRFHERMLHLKSFSMDGLEEEALDSLLSQASEESSDTSPEEEELSSEERKKTLIACLDQIEPELREALWLIYAEDMSYAQAAAVMGVNTKRIDHLLTRGKRAMKKELKKEGITDAYE